MNSNDGVCRLCMRREDKLESLEGGSDLVSKAVVDLFNIKVWLRETTCFSM